MSVPGTFHLNERRIIGAGALQGYQTPISKINKHSLATIAIQAVLLTSLRPSWPYDGLRGLYEGLRGLYEALSGLVYLVPELSRNDFFRFLNFPGTIFFRYEILTNSE